MTRAKRSSTSWVRAALCGLAVLVALLAVGVFAASQGSLYDDLGLNQDASQDDVKRAFRKLTRLHHPDTKETFDEKEEAKDTMARVLRAYAVLSDKFKRMEYDQTGIVPGEPIDPKDYTAQDIFAHYKQRMPIFSKTESLESVKLAERIKNFRGNRIFVIQVYDDDCSQCHTYSSVWETMFHSNLASAGILNMYRIDGKSAEAADVMKVLGLSYNGKEPTIVAYVDGEKWNLYGLRDALRRNKERIIFEHLLEFIMAFFYEPHMVTTSIKTEIMDPILKFLQEPRSPAASPGGSLATTRAPPLRVLFPKLTSESIPLAVHLRYGDRVMVRSLQREPLTDVIEQYCEMDIEVRDRRGDVVPMPEFLAVSTKPISDGRPIEVDEEMDEEAAEAAVAAAKEEGKCGGLHIGASAALTFEKASQFVQSHLPPLHEGLPAEVADGSHLPYLDSMAFFEVCKKNCVMWVRESCAAPVDALAKEELQATAKVLASDFLSFKTGYLCLDEQPDLAEYLRTHLSAHLDKAGARGPLLLALMNSDDHVLYALTGLQETAPRELSTRDVDRVLSDLLEAKSNVKAGDAATSLKADGVTVLEEDTPMSLMLSAPAFPISQRQHYYLMASTMFSMVSPTITHTLPFFLMWLVHTKVLGKKNTGPDAAAADGAASNGAAAPAAGNGASAPAAGLPKGFPTGKRPVPRPKQADPPRPKNAVGDYTKADLEEARTGKGFLVLVVDDRAASSEAMKLPLIMSDSRFTVRMVGSLDAPWKDFIREKVAAATGDATSSLPDGEEGLLLFAIRKGRMLGAAKSGSTDITSFLGDLLDGAVSANVELPDHAKAE